MLLRKRSFSAIGKAYNVRLGWIPFLRMECSDNWLVVAWAAMRLRSDHNWEVSVTKMS